MISFELGNQQTIYELASKENAKGKFVFRRDDLRFRLYLGEFTSHPALVKTLSLLKKGENEYRTIWGGGDFKIFGKELKFFGASGSYGRVPNSFLIDCCRHVKIPKIEKFIFSLTPYSNEDQQLEDRRKTWRDIGGYELDIQEITYVFDENMRELKV